MIRYVLEVCGSTEEAVRVLRRVSVHMSYNVTAVDAGRSGYGAAVPEIGLVGLGQMGLPICANLVGR